MRALSYSIDEALASLWRGRQSGVLSMAPIALALFVLGSVLIAVANLERLGAEWSRTAEMSIYLDDGATAEQRAAVEQQLANGDLVGGREFVSKTQALERFKRTFPDLATTVESVDGNPLPASYEVTLRPAADASATVDRLAESIRGLPGVSDVRYDRRWLDRLLSFVGLMRGVGFVLGAVLTLAAALTVTNVVRLALNARRDELEIMQLVGAPTAYVRGPFVMEGVLQGGIGALAALVALSAVFVAARSRYLAPLAASVNLSSVRFLPVELSLALVAGGMLVGCLAGLVAARGRV